MIIENLKNNKVILNMYIEYKKKMCSLLTHIAPVTATKYVHKYNTGKHLNLKNPQTFSETLQWLTSYGVEKLMDYVEVGENRDYFTNNTIR